MATIPWVPLTEADLPDLAELARACLRADGGLPLLADEPMLRRFFLTGSGIGGRDETVLQLNRRALARLTCPKALEIVPTATHLFEEPGTLDEVARLATGWFGRYLGGERSAGFPGVAR